MTSFRNRSVSGSFWLAIWYANVNSPCALMHSVACRPPSIQTTALPSAASLRASLVGEALGPRQLAGDLLVAGELLVVLGRRDDRHDHRPALGRLADLDHLEAIRFLVQLGEVLLQLGVVGQEVVVAGRVGLAAGRELRWRDRRLRVDRGRQQRGGQQHQDKDGTSASAHRGVLSPGESGQFGARTIARLGRENLIGAIRAGRTDRWRRPRPRRRCVAVTGQPRSSSAGTALPITTGTPAASSISRSFRLSPSAMTSPRA